MMVDAQVQPEDAIMHLLPGAGGFGDPLERDPMMVLDDVLDEKISPQYAEREYGVAIANGAVDKPRTRALRESRRSSH
jgi:N-methylhydantoinase B